MKLDRPPKKSRVSKSKSKVPPVHFNEQYQAAQDRAQGDRVYCYTVAAVEQARSEKACFDDAVAIKPTRPAESTSSHNYIPERVFRLRAINHNKTASIGLFKLPPEVRNIIWDRFIPKGHTLQIDLHGPPTTRQLSGNPPMWLQTEPPKQYFDKSTIGSHLEPAISRTCTLLRAETVPIYYHRQTFRIDAPFGSISPFLAMLGADRLKHIRKLELRVQVLGIKFAFRLMGRTYSATVDGVGCPGIAGAQERVEVGFALIVKEIRESMAKSKSNRRKYARL